MADAREIFAGEVARREKKSYLCETIGECSRIVAWRASRSINDTLNNRILELWREPRLREYCSYVWEIYVAHRLPRLCFDNLLNVRVLLTAWRLILRGHTEDIRASCLTLECVVRRRLAASP